ncbi:MAG TPA: HNH endonuclease signature motif containing protein [Blastocatellia bacterium]|nr:HNH endonuclease signature motif containing protein [Blastocatellia bacterium]HMV81541.1 HNH endonuclease signature motif containing protein [Blastocatellia bacterium]HMX30510.1 HNH endonuclease signature motif containing protein [Blastocatellia bacterium]HMZ17666.1 HNH endonuclease signature motif containing protein [Blastocatellia bacterium]HNG28528.1 HNH endonuclease signature motif containing protein [Blastocatellia bacterium]
MKRLSRELNERIRRQAKNRCGYCFSPQELLPYKLEIEHIHPKGLGGETIEINLWLACRECNAHKAMKIRSVDRLTRKTVKLFNPRKQNWHEHFDFSQDKTEIIGKTACGRATVETLQMNNFYQKTARAAWVEVGKFPPKE